MEGNPTITTRQLSTVDVVFAGGRVLRVGLLRGTNGERENLTLCLGWGDPWRGDPQTSLLLPAEAVELLRDALAILAETQ